MPTSFRYTGQLKGDVINLYFYNARWYDPALSHFIMADTIIPYPGDPASWDRYAYVRNNPVLRTDPTGHMDDDECRKCGGAGGQNASWIKKSGTIPPEQQKSVKQRLDDWYDDHPTFKPKQKPSSNTVTSKDLYASGNATSPRPPRTPDTIKPGQKPDIFTDEKGNIVANKGGASTFETPEQLGAAVKGKVWRLPSGTELKVFNDVIDGIPYGPQPSGHHSLVPNAPMTPEMCVNSFLSLPWQPVIGNNGKQLEIK